MVDKQTLDNVAEYVARGVALLDEKHPGWHTEIDLAVLALDDCSQCVLGQMFYDHVPDGYDDSFQVGVKEVLGMGPDDVDVAVLIRHGFDVWPNRLTEDQAYRDLTAEWKRVIAARQSELPLGGES
jgi:hypothetical protein